MKRVYLEITNACNLNCSFCTYEKGNSCLSLKEIDSYTSQIRPLSSYIYLHILGEPLLHPDFDAILKMLDDKGFHLQLVSNSIALKNHPDLLKHPCLAKLSLSVHSLSQIENPVPYLQYIDRLIENPGRVKIELRFYNEETLSEPVRQYYEHLVTRYGKKATKRRDSFQLKENVYLYFQPFFRWPDMKDPIISHEGRCLGGIDMIAINHDSKVCLCCLDPEAINQIGDLKKQSLEEILNSKVYLDQVKAFRDGKIISPLCARCSYRLRFKA